MKIWYQSSSLIGVDPRWEPYYESLKKHVQKVARSDTKVDVRGVKFGHPLRERSSYVQYLHQAQIIDNAIQAEREGYDAFCVACALDPGFREIREVVDIPVAFLSESCFHLASILASRFSLLSHSEEALTILRQRIKEYGLQEQFITSLVLDIHFPEDLLNAFKNPDPIIDVIKETGRKAVKLGMGMLVPACNLLNMVLVDAGLREVDGVPILDSAGVMVKAAEFMVDLAQAGISRSRAGLYTHLSKQELASIRNLYGAE